jgi:23S rRNA pseudouridine955/2504/2580 synthase
MTTMTLIAGENDHGRRLDRILRKVLSDCPLPLIHRLLRKGLILVNGKPAAAQTRVLKGSKISIPRLSAGKIVKKSIKIDKPQISAPVTAQAAAPPKIPQQKLETPQKRPDTPLKKPEKPIKPVKPERQNTPPALSVRFYHPPEILWQDSRLIAFNKPKGLAVHGQVSLDRMVQAFLINKLPPSLSFKPGPLHRLDKPSSGIVVFSASLEGANIFSDLMKEQKIKKTYIAIVEGSLEGKHFWTNYLVRDKEKKKTFVVEDEGEDRKGKIAITMVKPLAVSHINDKPYTLIEAEIETGRTHQIRAQSGFYGHPLAGDRKYGGSAFTGGFYLHAWKLEFLDNKIEAPLPPEFQKLVTDVFGYI